MRKPLAVGVATLAVALSFGLAACGSDDDEPSTNEDVLTKTELVSAADSICTSVNEAFTKLVDENLDDNSTREDGIEFVSDQAVPLYQGELEQLQALQPADDVAEQWTDLTDALESDLQDLEENPEVAIGGDSAFPNATKKARAFGLKVCGVD